MKLRYHSSLVVLVLTLLLFVPFFHSFSDPYPVILLRGQSSGTKTQREASVSRDSSLFARRLLVDHLADSLMQQLNTANVSKPVCAFEMNQIHSLFGEQLQYDRSICAPLINAPSTDPLTPEQYEALMKLLASSARYEQWFQGNYIIRRSLNRGDTGNNIPKNVLQRSRAFLYDRDIRKQLTLFREQHPTSGSDSPTIQLPATNIRAMLKNRFDEHTEFWHTAIYNTGRLASQVFGKLAGRIQGPNNAPKNALQLTSLVQPFDIVLMKAPQRLTDRLIPGYFGHVAICLGTDSLLIHELAPGRNISDYYEVFPLTAMTEAVRKVGVRISRLEEFAEGKVFLILRPHSLTEGQKKIILSNALKQLHKKYDFQFNLNSLDEITCTELIFVAYDYVNWKLEKIMGRYTLSPDGIVHSVENTGLFDVPAILHYGTIIRNPTWKEVETLMKE